MNGLSTVRGLRLALLGIACSGCASFSKGHLPERSLADYDGGRVLAAITYDLTGSTSFSLDDAMLAASSGPTVLKARVEPIFRRVFSEAEQQKTPGEWHVDMYYRETERNPAVTYTLVFFFIVSLGIVPAHAETDLYLEAKLKHDGATVKQYVYEESLSTWVHWFMLPWSFSHDPLERKAELIDNMVLNLVHDLASALPPAAPGKP